MERKLATIRKIKEIRPIDGADNIECIIIDGWQCIAKKNEFEVGDLCVYCEVDSFLPIKPEFEFLRKNCYKKLSDDTEGFRLKTIRLKGTYSQGLVLPISVLNKNVNENNIGEDISSELNIIKYEPAIPAQLSGKVKGDFPSFLKKTEEMRIQNVEWILDEYKDKPFYATEKLDGTSFTAYYNNGEFGICSRNFDLFETEDNTYWRIARKLKLEEKLKEYGNNIALQGELLGEGIQKNQYKLKGQTVYFFNIFNINTFKYFNYKMFSNRLFEMGLNSVPVISPIEGYFLPSKIEELLEYSQGKSQLNTKQEREGIVLRPFDDIVNPKGDRLSFKVISNKYLLKYEE
jgi:RNA ligase (TIGR02306 family)